VRFQSRQQLAAEAQSLRPSALCFLCTLCCEIPIEEQIMVGTKQFRVGVLILAVTCAVLAAGDEHKFSEAQLRYWAYQKVRKPPVPLVTSRARVRTQVDDFILK